MEEEGRRLYMAVAIDCHGNFLLDTKLLARTEGEAAFLIGQRLSRQSGHMITILKDLGRVTVDEQFLENVWADRLPLPPEEDSD